MCPVSVTVGVQECVSMIQSECVAVTTSVWERV